MQLCTTHKLAFYIGFSYSCARLGEPYGDHVPLVPEAEWIHRCPDFTKFLFQFGAVLTAVTGVVIGVPVVCVLIAFGVAQLLNGRCRAAPQPVVTPQVALVGLGEEIVLKDNSVIEIKAATLNEC